MKPLPIHSVALFASLTLGAIVSNSCGDNLSPVIPDDAMPMPDARPDDAGVLGHCVTAIGTDLSLEEVASDLADPLFVDAPKNDPRLFIVEQPGRILVVKDDALLPTPFLDMRGRVIDLGSEQGLLGLAFHPDYATNGRFFVNYTASSPSGATVVAEYTASAGADVANPTGKILLTIDQPLSNHNGGMLAFGPDGYLYISTGDGGPGGDPDNRAQDRNLLLGKILRIDVDNGDPYGIPSDNPYAGGGGLAEIWAYGLRNPWRFSFDSMNGDIYIGDVGQKGSEEINVVGGSVANANYGWRIAEGTLCYNTADPYAPLSDCDMSGTIAPVHEYPHTEERAVVTGGYVYRGDCLLDMKGVYFFGDFHYSKLYTFEYQGGAAVNFQEITDSIDPDDEVVGLTSYGTDGFGEIYVVSRGARQSPQVTGKVFRIVTRRP